jgi:hypothetical protein
VNLFMELKHIAEKAFMEYLIRRGGTVVNVFDEKFPLKCGERGGGGKGKRWKKLLRVSEKMCK